MQSTVVPAASRQIQDSSYRRRLVPGELAAAVADVHERVLIVHADDILGEPDRQRAGGAHTSPATKAVGRRTSWFATASQSRLRERVEVRRVRRGDEQVPFPGTASHGGKVAVPFQMPSYFVPDTRLNVASMLPAPLPLSGPYRLSDDAAYSRASSVGHADRDRDRPPAGTQVERAGGH